MPVLKCFYIWLLVFCVLTRGNILFVLTDEIQTTNKWSGLLSKTPHWLQLSKCRTAEGAAQEEGKGRLNKDRKQKRQKGACDSRARCGWSRGGARQKRQRFWIIEQAFSENSVSLSTPLRITRNQSFTLIADLCFSLQILLTKASVNVNLNVTVHTAVEERWMNHRDTITLSHNYTRHTFITGWDSLEFSN